MSDETTLDQNSCPKCYRLLPADAPAGICPQCLMAGGLESTIISAAPRAELPQPGATFGPYQLGRLLGSGGMGPFTWPTTSKVSAAWP